MTQAQRIQISSERNARSVVSVWRLMALFALSGSWFDVAFADAPPGHYDVDAVAGTVKDNRTGLTWQRAVNEVIYAWADAKTHCATLSLSGGGWRLPTKKELLTVVDPAHSDPAVDPVGFPLTPKGLFWSASAFAGSTRLAWVVDFRDGSSFNHDVGESEHVRCVR
jgi:hypothetical protein